MFDEWVLIFLGLAATCLIAAALIARQARHKQRYRYDHAVATDPISLYAIERERLSIEVTRLRGLLRPLVADEGQIQADGRCVFCSELIKDYGGVGHDDCPWALARQYLDDRDAERPVTS